MDFKQANKTVQFLKDGKEPYPTDKEIDNAIDVLNHIHIFLSGQTEYYLFRCEINRRLVNLESIRAARKLTL